MLNTIKIMKNHFNIFINHCAVDAVVAKNVSEVLNTLSLHQFRTWFSSSEEIDEGFMPGDMWFQRICNEILQSDVEAYTYMQTWILQNKHSGAKMAMYEITNSVSAMQV